MPADVDKTVARDLRKGRVGRVAQRLVGAAEGREREDAEHGIQQPRLRRLEGDGGRA